MIREAFFKKQFRKDLERIKRKGRDTGRLLETIELLRSDEPLSTSHRDHALVGNLKAFR